MGAGSFSAARRRSAVTGPTSTQWRVRLPRGSVSWTQPNIGEIEMLNAVGGTDQCNGGTADASSEFSGSFTAANAFDNGAGVWAPSTGNATCWIRYTFGSAVAVPSFTMLTPNATTGPKQVILEYWDGAAWVITYDSGALSDLSWSVSTTKTFTPTVPSFSVAPSITSASGFYAEGDTLTGVPGTSDGTLVGYKWQKDGVDISGQTTTSYTLQSGDSTHNIRFVHTTTNGYATTTAYSTPVTAGTPTYGSGGNRKTSDGNDRLTSTGDTRIITIRTA